MDELDPIIAEFKKYTSIEDDSADLAETTAKPRRVRRFLAIGAIAAVLLGVGVAFSAQQPPSQGDGALIPSSTSTSSLTPSASLSVDRGDYAVTKKPTRSVTPTKKHTKKPTTGPTSTGTNSPSASGTRSSNPSPTCARTLGGRCATSTPTPTCYRWHDSRCVSWTPPPTPTPSCNRNVRNCNTPTPTPTRRR